MRCDRIQRRWASKSERHGGTQLVHSLVEMRVKEKMDGDIPLLPPSKGCCHWNEPDRYDSRWWHEQSRLQTRKRDANGQRDTRANEREHSRHSLLGWIHLDSSVCVWAHFQLIRCTNHINIIITILSKSCLRLCTFDKQKAQLKRPKRERQRQRGWDKRKRLWGKRGGKGKEQTQHRDKGEERSGTIEV